MNFAAAEARASELSDIFGKRVTEEALTSIGTGCGKKTLQLLDLSVARKRPDPD